VLGDRQTEVLMKRFLVVPVAVLIASAPAQTAPKHPQMRCEPKTIHMGESLTLVMPLPHEGELGVLAPHNRFLFIAFAPESSVTPPLASSTFKPMGRLRLDSAVAVGLPEISPDASSERIFTAPGTYRFVVSQNLETEDDLGLNLVCDVRLVK
jgi:hypothetical protein